MGTGAKRSDPALWDAVKSEITRGDKGGNPGQWSARKAQIAVKAYKQRGGGYEGEKRGDNALRQWTEEDWGTKSGERSRDTGERYLPKEAREHLSAKDYAATSKKKRADTRAGHQFSSQPAAIARATASHRGSGRNQDRGDAKSGIESKAALYAEAKRRGIAGRSKMRKEELAAALRSGSNE